MNSVRYRLLGLCLLFCLALSGSLGDLVHTWQFTNETNYAVSDDILVRVDPTPPGKAELILQPDEVIKTEMGDYYAASNLNRLAVGPDTSLRLVGSAGSYSLAGNFTSREFLRPLGGVWKTIDGKGENTIHSGQSLTGEVSEDADDLVALMHFNHTWTEEKSGGVLNTHGLGVGFVDGRLGSACANLWSSWVEPLNVLNGANGATFACWVYLRANEQWKGIIYSSGTYDVGIEQAGNYTVRLYVENASGFDRIYSPAMTASTWYWVVGTWDGSSGQMAFYINGERQTLITTGPTGNLVLTTPFIVNAKSTAGSDVGRTRIDETAIWNRSLSAVEVSTLYRALSALRFRVRSGGAVPLAGSFIGPDGTESSDYFGFADELVDTNNFSVSDRYMQYRALLYSDAAQRATPYLRSVSIETSDGSFFTDNTWGSRALGTYDSGIMNETDHVGTPYLGLVRKPNGGVYGTGTYTSRILDWGGEGAYWDTISWDEGDEMPLDTAGLVGAWLMEGGLSPAIGTVFGSETDVSFTKLSKMGTDSAVFNGTSSKAVFAVEQSVESLELWLKTDAVNAGVLQIIDGDDATVEVLVTNRQIEVTGLSGNTAQIFINGKFESPKLVSGWNHLAVTFDTPLSVTNITLGIAAGTPFPGMFDNLAIYRSGLWHALIRAHVAEGRPHVAGRVRAQVRYSNGLPLTGAFGGPGGYYENGAPVEISDQQYLQYRLVFEGDGSGTPTADDIDVGTFLDDTPEEILEGTFDRTTWFGDGVGMRDLTAGGTRNLNLALDGDAMGLWHMDEESWVGSGARVLNSKTTQHGTRGG
ncbi:MAG: LamG domain-containing protein, partial [Lentisphaerae bacterium]|nr:LamG domain-containing protein [Lentisphaerota bacterium]